MLPKGFHLYRGIVLGFSGMSKFHWTHVKAWLLLSNPIGSSFWFVNIKRVGFGCLFIRFLLESRRLIYLFVCKVFVGLFMKLDC